MKFPHPLCYYYWLRETRFSWRESYVNSKIILLWNYDESWELAWLGLRLWAFNCSETKRKSPSNGEGLATESCYFIQGLSGTTDTGNNKKALFSLSSPAARKCNFYLIFPPEKREARRWPEININTFSLIFSPVAWIARALRFDAVRMRNTLPRVPGEKAIKTRRTGSNVKRQQQQQQKKLSQELKQN